MYPFPIGHFSGGAAFHPLDYGPFFMFAEPTYLYEDDARLDPAETGDLALSLKDGSGNNNHFARAISGSIVDMADFNGVGSYDVQNNTAGGFRLTGISVNNDATTVFLAIKNPAISDNIDHSLFGSGSLDWTVAYDSNDNRVWFWMSGGGYQIASTVHTGPIVFAARTKRVGGDIVMQAWRNLTSLGTTTAVGASTVALTELLIGLRAVSTRPGDGPQGLPVIFDKSLTDQEVLDVAGWMMTKIGI